MQISLLPFYPAVLMNSKLKYSVSRDIPDSLLKLQYKATAFLDNCGISVFVDT